MNILRLAVKTGTVLRHEGTKGIVERVLRRASKRWNAEEPLGIAWTDVSDPDAPDVGPTPTTRKVAGEPLEVGWLISPPGPASGGHTTIFRMVQALELAGHRCIIFIYEPGRSGSSGYAELIRTWWPGVKAEVRPVTEILPDLDAYVATAWQTAHVLAGRRMAGERFYFAQDFEPYFYPNGDARALAEDSYRFGFRTLTMGRMIADELRVRFGIQALPLDFGCDTDVYGVVEGEARSGVVFYSKPGVPRRGYQLGVATLERFHELRPEVPIHTYGMVARDLPFPANVHGHLTPAELNVLYNTCRAGLALSFTNVSLIPYELLAAGVVPVMNDWAGCRTVLENRHVLWAQARPDALAEALCRAVDSYSSTHAQALNSSVRTATWGAAGRSLTREIERSCWPATAGTLSAWGAER